MHKRLGRKFYEQKTLVVAKELLGKFLVRSINSKTIAGKIIETEAYIGTNDLASHASKGRTPRTEVMYGPAGHAYVYLIYGMYHCMNISTERTGFPAAVLIRALNIPSAHGPGRLCRLLKIDRKMSGADVVIGTELWVEDRGIKIPRSAIKRTPRIGVDYAKHWKDKPWRFVVNSNK